MNRILIKDESLELTNTRKIVGRNRIIHGYDTVSDKIFWNIIIEQLPVLKNKFSNY
jgi:uncharacterized protein with HEPN domain